MQNLIDNYISEIRKVMLRMVGFGDNIGSGFPTILNAWKEQRWETPELIEDTVLNQVSLILKTKKAANKIGEKKWRINSHRENDK